MKIRRRLLNDEAAEVCKARGLAVTNVGEDLNVLYMSGDKNNRWTPVVGAVPEEATGEVPLIQGTADMLRQMFEGVEGCEPELDIFAVPPEAPKMTVVTNLEGFMGASMILDAEVQEKLKVIYGDSFIVLPSSIHEVIVVDDCEDKGELNNMVAQINANCLDAQDVVADHAYRFSNGKFTAIL